MPLANPKWSSPHHRSKDYNAANQRKALHFLSAVHSKNWCMSSVSWLQKRQIIIGEHTARTYVHSGTLFAYRGLPSFFKPSHGLDYRRTILCRMLHRSLPFWSWCRCCILPRQFCSSAVSLISIHSFQWSSPKMIAMRVDCELKANETVSSAVATMD